MFKRISMILLLAVLLMPAVSPAAAQDVELRFMCYQDGTECEVYEDLLNRFSEENPGITVVVDQVPYATVRDNLRVQVAAGEAPDMARITDFGGMTGFYLDLRPLMMDPSVLEANYPEAVLAAFRASEDDNGLYGFPDGVSMTAPFINRTLFEQAGIEVPSGDVTWEEWRDVIVQVAEATETPYAIALDNKGHRFAAAGFAMGIKMFDEDGNFSLENDEGYRAFAEFVKGWHDDGITPREVWLGSGGEYTAANTYFTSAQVVMYYSGSWNVNSFGTDIGDAFDWAVAPNPVGPGGSAGATGGAGLVGFAQTEHPEAVASVMEYLLQPEVGAEFAARTLQIPANKAVIDYGVDFETDNEAVAAALTQFAIEATKVQAPGVQMNLHPLAFAYYDSSNTRLAQYFAGELTLDEAMARLQEDLDEALANLEG
jgi:alpha-1,4-digalacturonate transport system substrate-binding protein